MVGSKQMVLADVEWFENLRNMFFKVGKGFFKKAIFKQNSLAISQMAQTEFWIEVNYSPRL